MNEASDFVYAFMQTLDNGANQKFPKSMPQEKLAMGHLNE